MESLVGSDARGTKLKEVAELLSQLKLDVVQKSLSPSERDGMLEKLKIYGRSPEGSDPIFTKDVLPPFPIDSDETGIAILADQGFQRDPNVLSKDALRCLANALFLDAKTRQMLVELGYAPRLAEQLKKSDSEDEFLLSRILFLLTYEKSLDIEALIRENQLADNINYKLSEHMKKTVSTQSTTQDGAALAETLKLLFNILYFHPNCRLFFFPSLLPVLEIIRIVPIPPCPLEPPITHLINLLINLDLKDQTPATQTTPDQSVEATNTHSTETPEAPPIPNSSCFPPSNPEIYVERLISILSLSVIAYSESVLDTLAAPLLTSIRRFYEISPHRVQKRMQSLLLPSDNDRLQPLGKLDNLPSRLLRLSSSPMAPTLRDLVLALLFELSGKDATTFIYNIGYGFASGFLMTHGIAVPEGSMAPDSSPANENQGNARQPVNPITGQLLDKEAPVEEGPPMTQEEKEREAERLFVLFERLRKTGVMDVQNPLQEAVGEGRFEELNDDA
ncbi:MAG: hypothetical protein M1829_004489 [Trizodia sp. TS-e1964]|nr:MAG: hypothetical protein M1829_004489 [Trizodia sp. TS-e1964]